MSAQPENLRCKIVVGVEGDRTFLFWVEASGEDYTLHSIACVRGVGTADISVTAPMADIDRMWLGMVQDHFNAQCNYVLKAIKEFER